MKSLLFAVSVFPMLMIFSCGQTMTSQLDAPVPQKKGPTEKFLYAFAKKYAGTYSNVSKTAEELKGIEFVRCGAQLIIEEPSEAAQKIQELSSFNIKVLTDKKGANSSQDYSVDIKKLGVSNAEELKAENETEWNSFKRFDLTDDTFFYTYRSSRKDEKLGKLHAFSVTKIKFKVNEDKKITAECLAEDFLIIGKLGEENFEEYHSRTKPWNDPSNKEKADWMKYDRD